MQKKEQKGTKARRYGRNGKKMKGTLTHVDYESGRLVDRSMLWVIKRSEAFFHDPPGQGPHSGKYREQRVIVGHSGSNRL